jgi:hypothetical protein
MRCPSASPAAIGAQPASSTVQIALHCGRGRRHHASRPSYGGLLDGRVAHVGSAVLRMGGVRTGSVESSRVGTYDALARHGDPTPVFRGSINRPRARRRDSGEAITSGSHGMPVVQATTNDCLPTEPASTSHAGDAPNLRTPELFVCHGDDGGPSFHPCRRVQESLRAAGIDYRKAIGGHGSPFPFLRRDAREELQAATGTRKLPTLKLSDGTIISNSRAILAWVEQQS